LAPFGVFVIGSYRQQIPPTLVVDHYRWLSQLALQVAKNLVHLQRR
jgi:hypothetical protein